jgi:hypothetical protein
MIIKGGPSNADFIQINNGSLFNNWTFSGMQNNFNNMYFQGGTLTIDTATNINTSTNFNGCQVGAGSVVLTSTGINTNTVLMSGSGFAIGTYLTLNGNSGKTTLQYDLLPISSILTQNASPTLTPIVIQTIGATGATGSTGSTGSNVTSTYLNVYADSSAIIETYTANVATYMTFPNTSVSSGVTVSDSSTFVIGSTGKYKIDLSVNNFTVGTLLNINLEINGSTSIPSSLSNRMQVGYTSAQSSAILNLNNGDSLRIYVLSSTTNSTSNATTGYSSRQLNIVRVA